MLKQLVYLFLFIAANVGSAFVGIFTLPENQTVAAIWPATGVALATILLGGWTYLPAIFIAAVAVNFSIGTPLSVAFVIGAANTVQAVIGYLILYRWRPIDLNLNRAKDYFRLLFYTGLLLPIPFAIFGTFIFQTFFHLSDTWQNSAFLWWMADSLGVIILTPLILIWRRWEKEQTRKTQIYEAIFGCLLAFIVGQVIFLEWFNVYFDFTPRAFIMTLFIVWAAVRFGRHATLILSYPRRGGRTIFGQTIVFEASDSQSSI